MGVYIPNMEMPKTCFSCSFNDGLFCSLIDDDADALLSDKPVEEVSTRRLDACPLIEIDLVRCGECKYSGESLLYPIEMVCKYHLGHTYYTEADRFCYYGERRSDGHI